MSKENLGNPPEVNFSTKATVHKREYKLITPLFGGGVEPGWADPINIIRASEVRGHLRFWWRATQLHRFASIKDMAAEESKIWGSNEVPSEVKLLVKIVKFDQRGTKAAYTIRPGRNGGRNQPQASDQVIPYAAFPLQPESSELDDLNWKSEPVLKDVTFTLALEYPDKYKREIEDALWAWETFGGIGARTRRGFGALQCLSIDGIEKILSTPENLKNEIESKLENFVIKTPFNDGTPHLSIRTQFRLTAKKNSAFDAWKYLINQYQSFRQSRIRPRGRSNWPEPVVIRRKFGRWTPLHAPVPTVPDKMPRAKFGLPILFHFSKHEYPDVTLQGQLKTTDDPGIDRMASPLILRPIACKDGNIEVAVGMALILEWTPIRVGQEAYTPPGGLFLDNGLGQVFSDLTSSEVSSFEPMNATGQTDPLKAFLMNL